LAIEPEIATAHVSVEEVRECGRERTRDKDDAAILVVALLPEQRGCLGASEHSPHIWVELGVVILLCHLQCGLPNLNAWCGVSVKIGQDHRSRAKEQP
jgi:hypothetical protein